MNASTAKLSTDLKRMLSHDSIYQKEEDIFEKSILGHKFSGFGNFRSSGSSLGGSGAITVHLGRKLGAWAGQFLISGHTKISARSVDLNVAD
jgi:hypothetical protein